MSLKTRPVGDAEVHEILRTLRVLPQFDRFGNDELTSIVMNLKIADVPKGDTVCREGETGEAMFLIRFGEVAIQKEGKVSPLLLTVLPAGAIFGEMSLLDGSPRSASAVAQTDAGLVVIDRSGIDDLALIDEGLACNFLIAVIKTACNKIRLTQETLVKSIALLVSRA